MATSSTPAGSPRRSAEGASSRCALTRGRAEGLEGRRFKGEYMPINQMQGVQQNVAQLVAMMPASRARDYEDVLARLEALPTLVDQTVVLMKEGLARGITPPRITLRDV